ncbi:MAG: UvrD-helicase domain-containing protein [Planctomycetota bacterium]|jgi:ATP-dependent helicase/nuclease subunit A|nr:UvrD-helicase domain-containing protein [Planctomycetota bacterium]
MPKAAKLPDQLARQRIENDIDANFLVEAAAGSGKTTCLVSRLATLARQGRIAPTRLVAAVTFTNKAAAELHERLEAKIVQEIASFPEGSQERGNLETARESLRQCHIGTIHSFAARLLRERPVEAGVDPGFVEIDQEVDQEYRRQAWEKFTVEFPKNSQLADTFARLDLSLGDLRTGFDSYTLYPDVEDWPGIKASLDPAGKDIFLGEVRNLVADTTAYADDSGESGNDELLPIYRLLTQWLKRHPGKVDDLYLFLLLDSLKEDPNIVQRVWKQFGGDHKSTATAEKIRYSQFYDSGVRPLLANLRSARYAAAFQAFTQAGAIYDQLRQQAGALNFRDLLMKTASLLRAYPEVRRELAERYPCLLVDEAQDTDPVQAEILFLLAGSNHRETDWRRASLRPGALFLVGDPKQSIYRFTRADIAVYSQIKELLLKSGGETLYLSVNFRSRPVLLTWVNSIFAQSPVSEAADSPPLSPDSDGDAEVIPVNDYRRFPTEDNIECPAYVPLQTNPASVASDSRCFEGIYGLILKKTVRRNPKRPDVQPVGNEDILVDEAERIADFIAGALEKPMLVFSPPDSFRPVNPADFLVLTPGKGEVAILAEAIRHRGIEVNMAGGGLNIPESAPDLLLLVLEALNEPDNPILSVALLRSRLFGISDTDLYAWKQAEGKFDLLSNHPEKGEGPEVVRQSLVGLRDCLYLFRHLTPFDALRVIIERLGLWVLAGEGGETGAGSFLTLVDCLASNSEALTTPSALLKQVETLLASDRFNPLPLRGQTAAAVRVMNLHKAKGLEAPVVFLTGTNDRVHKPGQAVDRSGSKTTGRLAIWRDNVLIACPADWEEMEAREARFLAAERLRLAYVAATRAAMAVVLSVQELSQTSKNAMLPSLGDWVELPEDKYRPIPSSPPPAWTPAGKADFQKWREEREELLQNGKNATYRVIQARLRPSSRPIVDTAHLTASSSPEEDMHLSSEDAMAFGEVIHQVLEKGNRWSGAKRKDYLGQLLADHSLPAELVDKADELVRGVLRSDLWRRAKKAKQSFRELPFTMVEDGADGLACWVRGVMDLVFEEEDGWVVVDYKTNVVDKAYLFGVAESYRGQLEAYVAALKLAIPGVVVKEIGIFFIRQGNYVTIPL